MHRQTLSPDELVRELSGFRTRFERLLQEIRRAIVGYDELTHDCATAIFAQGHVLLEGVPGLGKTYLVKVLSRVLDLTFGRVQCTPDLMPADILGTHVVSEDEHRRRSLRFENGPVFKNLLLVDEINRTTPKTQAALLEVMQEHGVTAGNERFALPEPFFVLATQNPLDMEGTYPLPEAQLDRFFFKLRVPFPNLENLMEISDRTSGFDEPELAAVMDGPELLRLQRLLAHIPVAKPLTRYAASLILATHPESAEAPPRVRRLVSYGASPRGLQTLIRAARVHCAVAGRTAVSLDDIRRAALPALRHRMILNFEGEAAATDVDDLIQEILRQTATPAQEAA
jgi:MoxR-like ATPase